MVGYIGPLSLTLQKMQGKIIGQLLDHLLLAEKLTTDRQRIRIRDTWASKNLLVQA